MFIIDNISEFDVRHLTKTRIQDDLRNTFSKGNIIVGTTKTNNSARRHMCKYIEAVRSGSWTCEVLSRASSRTTEFSDILQHLENACKKLAYFVVAFANVNDRICTGIFSFPLFAQYSFPFVGVIFCSRGTTC